MKADKLFHVLSAIHPLPAEMRSSIEAELEFLSLPRYFHLLERAQIAKHVYFIDTGFAMTYTFFNGKKTIDAFWKPGQFVVSLPSFIERIPSEEYIQLAESSSLISISYRSLQKLSNDFSEIQALYRIVVSRCYYYSKSRFRDMQHLNALERHAKLLRDYPGIEQIVTQDSIASYLGITPQSLSRLKKLNR